jgi:uncharacterized protein (DUF433 family)
MVHLQCKINKMERNWTKYIGLNPEIRFGKAIIRGTRITVADVLGWLSVGMTPLDIIADFPELNQEQIFASIAYAADQERTTKIIAA